MADSIPRGLEGRQWSEPLAIHEAVGKAPVLVQLLDGHRGLNESLSFSLGDVMALEGEITAKGRRLVLAHYTSEMEEEDEEEESGSMYRALLTIPWIQLPPVDVLVCQDPEGMAYSNFVSANFPHCNWLQQQDELLEDMDEGDYDNIHEITPKPCTPSSPSSASQSGTTPVLRRPPTPPPKPKASFQGQQSPRSGGCDPQTPPARSPQSPVKHGARGNTDEGDYHNIHEITPKPCTPSSPSSASQSGTTPGPRRPPPPPPKPKASLQGQQSPSSGGRDPQRPPPRPPKSSVKHDARDNTAQRQDTQAQGKQPVLPPRPPRSAIRSSSPESSQVPCSETDTRAQGGGFFMPTFAELASPAPAGRSPPSSAVQSMSKGLGVGVGQADVLFPSEQAKLQNRQSEALSDVGEYIEIVDDSYDEINNLENEARNANQPKPPQKVYATQKPEKEEEKKVYATGPKEEKKDVYSKTKSKGTKTKTAPVKPTVMVQPLRSASSSLETRAPVPAPKTSSPAESSDEEECYEIPSDSGKALKTVTCKELCTRLHRCGMEKLAQTCETNCLDGAFFCSLADNDLKKPPFSLNDFEIGTKLLRIKMGWVPK